MALIPPQVDPTQPPEYSQYPGYEWEDVPYLNPPEIIDYVDPLFEDPWMSDYFDDFYSMYYEAFLA